MMLELLARTGGRSVEFRIVRTIFFRERKNVRKSTVSELGIRGIFLDFIKTNAEDEQRFSALD